MEGNIMSDHKALTLFLKISQHRMHSHYLPKLVQSIQQLDITMLWTKEVSTLNSVGSIVLHICEHIRRNSIRLASKDHVDFGKGIEDHFPDTNFSLEELKEVVKEVFNEFNAVMVNLIAEAPSENDMHNLYHLIEHTGYHLGQVVDRTKRLSDTSFDFCQNGINEKNLKLLIEG
jgi:uncharacterized damage-inducible protein DinB